MLVFDPSLPEGGLRASGQGRGGGHTSLRVGGGQRDFSCPGQKCPALDAPSSRPSRRLPGPSLPYTPPTATDDDMCHITSTCIRRGSASNTPACSRLNGRWELKGDMWHLRHSSPAFSEKRGQGFATAGWESGRLRQGSGWRVESGRLTDA